MKGLGYFMNSAKYQVLSNNKVWYCYGIKSTIENQEQQHVTMSLYYQYYIQKTIKYFIRPRR